MISLTLGTNTRRATVIVEPNATVRSVLAENQVSMSGKTINLDGSPVREYELDKTFVELGIVDGATAALIAVEKADSAM